MLHPFIRIKGYNDLGRKSIALAAFGGAWAIVDISSCPPPIAELSMNFEKSLRRLDEIMAALEGEQVGLDASLKLFEEGIELLRSASAELDKAETKVQVLLERSEGGFELRETDL
jgi:exodeoxyribonuclease VII small subunit